MSLDTPEKNAKFAASMGASLPVVSDAKGILRAIDKSVRPATAGADIVAKLEELGFPRRMTSAPPAP